MVTGDGLRPAIALTRARQRGTGRQPFIGAPVRRAAQSRFLQHMNSPEDFTETFDGLQPWAGNVPRGFGVDFVGTFTDARFRVNWPGDPSSIGGRFLHTRLAAWVNP